MFIISPEKYKLIPMISNDKIYSFLKDSVYGGYTHVFKPIGENLYYYDVNSHYPASALQPMPSGDIIYSEYNFIDYKNKPFDKIGAYKATVDVPADDLYPVLPVRTENGTIYPTGHFSGT